MLPLIIAAIFGFLLNLAVILRVRPSLRVAACLPIVIVAIGAAWDAYLMATTPEAWPGASFLAIAYGVGVLAVVVFEDLTHPGKKAAPLTGPPPPPPSPRSVVPHRHATNE